MAVFTCGALALASSSVSSRIRNGGAGHVGSSRAALPPLGRSRTASKYNFIVCAGPGNEENKSTDWDTAWSKYKNSSGGGIPRSNVSTKPPTFNRGSGEWNRGPTRDDIRKQERTLLDIWTKESFSQLSVAIIVLLFVAMVVAAGPLPTDARCTLPWC